jgi:hypothetical protein
LSENESFLSPVLFSMTDQQFSPNSSSSFDFDNSVVGSTGWEGFGYYPVGNNALKVNDPSTYRYGIYTLSHYLLRLNHYEKEMQDFEQEVFDTYPEKIKQILSLHPTFCQKTMCCVWTLLAFKMMNRLDELPINPIIGFLLSLQNDDGGFAAGAAETTSNLETTLKIVGALLQVGVQPLDVDALEAFISRLQCLDDPDPLYNGQFGNTEEESWAPDFPSTSRVLTLLSLLGRPIPHRSVVETNLNLWYQLYLDHREQCDYSTYSPVVDGAIAYFCELIDLAVGLGNQSLIDTLRPQGWELYQVLPDEKLEKGYTGLMHSLNLAGKASFPPTTFLSPGTVSLSLKGGSQSFVLCLENPTPIAFNLSFKQLSLVDWSPQEVSFTGLPSGSFILPPNSSLTFPFTFDYQLAEHSKRNDLPDSLCFKLVVERLLYGNAGYSSSTIWPVTSELFFDLPVTKNLSPLLLGLIIGLPAIGLLVAGLLIFLRSKKRDKKRV